jgi:hypothetical protein
MDLRRTIREDAAYNLPTIATESEASRARSAGDANCADEGQRARTGAVEGKGGGW